MTQTELFWFDCPICHTHFLSYVKGHYLWCHQEDIHTDGYCFYDNTIGEIHNNHILNRVKDIRKCRRCRVAQQLEDFI